MNSSNLAAELAELPRAVHDVMRKAVRRIAPPPDLLVSEWAEQYRYLSPESAAQPGKWHNDQAPHAVEIMDCYNNPEVSEIVMMVSAQTAKTEIINNMIGYSIDCNPGPILNLNPTGNMAKTWSKDRLAPMVRDTPRLARLINTKVRNADNEIFHKNFPGGHITMIGANSATELAGRPIRDFYTDEVDRAATAVGAGENTEGDSIGLADVRTTTFHDAKLIRASTPTRQGFSRIAEMYEYSDKRIREVKCPHCGEYHFMDWKHCVYNEDAKSPDELEVHMACPECGGMYDDSGLYSRLQDARWRATAPFHGIAGFHLNAFYSLFTTWKKIVWEYIRDKDNPAKLQIWWNTKLGLPFKEDNQQIDGDSLKARAEDYEAEVPDGVLLLLCIVDVQSDRLEYEVIGYGKHEESWGIERAGLYGDPMDESASVWKELDELLRNKRWTRKSGHGMGVYRCYVDSGYQATTVYQRVKEMKYGSVFPCKGSNTYDAPIAKAPTWVKLPSGSKTRLFIVGSQDAKTLVASRFKLEKPGPGYCHIPKSYPDSFYEELVAEERVPRMVNRVIKYLWQPIKDKPNESVDLRAYGLSAIRTLHPNWSDFERRISEVEMLSVEDSPATPPGAAPPDVTRRKRRRSYSSGARTY